MESAAAAAVVVAVVAVVVEEEGEEEAAHADDLSRDWNRRCELRFNYRFSYLDVNSTRNGRFNACMTSMPFRNNSINHIIKG